MKSSFLAVILFLSYTWVISSCSSSNESGTPAKNAQVSELVQKQIEAWEKLSPIAQKTLGSFEGVIRNRNWGDPIDAIQEKLDKSENQPSNGVSYTQYLDDTDLNFVDISYTGANQQLTVITFDIFLENPDEVNALKEELESFLSVKFGKNSTYGKKINWENEKTRIDLEDVSTSKDPGLQLVFSKRT
ncbi:MAG: hypothetical protein RI995_1160 [Bacteroidota bacterium]|jgi:hypothetical protein